MKPYTDCTDAELVRDARRDPDAFAVLYDRYAQRAVGWARRGGVPDADVLDLVGELFAQAWRSRRRFRDPGDGDAAGWLFGIARNLVARYHRRGRMEDSARRRLGLEIESSAAEIDRVEARLSALDGRVELEAALAALPPAQARAVRLRVVDDLNYAEIGTRLSCTPVTARKRVSLGLRTLRAHLNPEA